MVLVVVMLVVVVVVVTLPMSMAIVLATLGFRKNVASGTRENKRLMLSLKCRLSLTLLLSLKLWDFAAGAWEAATEGRA